MSTSPATPADLALTTDFRDVFAEVVERQLRPADMGQVFPGYEIDRRRYRGVLEA